MWNEEAIKQRMLMIKEALYGGSSIPKSIKKVLIQYHDDLLELSKEGAHLQSKGDDRRE